MKSQLALTCALAACLCGAGCDAEYITPGRPADLKSIARPDVSTDTSISAAMAKKPLATLPCGIAAVRIQAAGYQSDSTETYGSGNYCIVTTRDVESNVDLARVAKLPQVIGLAPLNRLLLPEKLETDLQLRQAAASVHADMLLVYTLDTASKLEDHLTPASVLTLGLSPNVTAHAVTTASAVLMDTRNGYVYGFAEATEHADQLTNGWMTDVAASEARHRAELSAFKSLVDHLQHTWSGVVLTLSQSNLATATPPSVTSTAPAPMAVAADVPTVVAPNGLPSRQSTSSEPHLSLGRTSDLNTPGTSAHFAAGGAMDPLSVTLSLVVAGLAMMQAKCVNPGRQ